MPACIEYGEERHQECSQTADQGYNECSASEDQGYNECCTWAPCSWFCDAWVWVTNIVCVAWTWVSNVVCVAWTWITTAVCVLWDVVVAVLNVVFVLLEGIFGVLLSGIAALFELLEAIPFVGAIIKFILNGITIAIGVIVGLGDFVLGAIGIRPEKKLRICTVILRDEMGNALADTDSVVRGLQLAADVFKRDANVRLMPMGLWRYEQGFSGSSTVTPEWVQTDKANSGANILDQGCLSPGVDLLLGVAASELQLKMTAMCFVGAWRRVFGFGSPITAFIIRQFTDAVGCSNAIEDIIRIQGITLPVPPATVGGSSGGLPPDSPRTIGHESLHACLLGHNCVDDDVQNIMATTAECEPDSNTQPDRANPHLSEWQVLLMRSSKHVSYF